MSRAPVCAFALAPVHRFVHLDGFVTHEVVRVNPRWHATTR